MLGTLLGCAATRAPRAIQIPAGKPLAEIPATDLLELVEARGQAIKSLRSVAKLKISLDASDATQEGERRFSTTQAVLAKAPASFRLESLSPFGVSYAVVSDGSAIAVLAPQEGTIYRARADQGAVASATGVDVAPSDITRILLGLPPLPRVEERLAWLSQPDASLVPTPKGGELESAVILHAPSAERSGETVVIELARFRGDPAVVPVTFERIDQTGRVELRVEFGDFEPHGSWSVATTIDVWAPGSHATLEYRDIELNPVVTEEQFRLATPAGMRDEPLVPAAPDGRSPL